MRRRFLIITFIFLLLTAVMCLVTACQFFQIEKKGESYAINLPTEITLYCGDSYTLKPMTVDDNGNFFTGEYEYSSDSRGINVDYYGKITIEEAPLSFEGKITVKEVATGVSATVKVIVRSKITEIEGLADSSGNLIEDDTITFRPNETKVFYLVTEGGNADISNLCEQKFYDNAGEEKTPFDIEINKNKITLTATGFGRGKYVITDRDKQNVSKKTTYSVKVEILTGNENLDRGILSGSSSMLSAEERVNYKTLKLDGVVESTIDLGYFSSLERVILCGSEFYPFTIYNSSYDYLIEKDYFQNYYDDEDWKEVIDDIYPFKMSLNNHFCVLHNCFSGELAFLPIVEEYTLPVLTEKGYTNTGWDTLAEIKVTDDEIKNSVYGIHLFAHWERNADKIIFDENISEGSTRSQTVYTDTVAVLDQNVFVRSGYTFEGWATSQDGEVICTDGGSFSVGREASYRLYAVWKAVENSIIFYSNGGTGEMANQIIATDKTADLSLNAFTLEGFTFVGWSETPNGEKKYSDGGSYKMGVEKENSLYAVWQANNNSLIFYKNDGTEEKKVQQIKSEATVKLEKSTFVYKGYTFMGWSRTASGDVELNDQDDIVWGRESELSLYAVWQANNNSIVFQSAFVAEGGSGSMNNQIIATLSTEPLTPNGFALRGYDFVGWATSQGGEVVYNDEDNYTMGVESSYNLYAVWKKVKYSIGYGGLENGINNSSNPSFYYVDSDDIVLEEPTRAGYSFVGWYSDTECTKVTTGITGGSVGDTGFMAKWQANTNTLILDSCGGSGNMDNILIPTDSVTNLPLCTYVRAGYVFVGWRYVNDLDAPLAFYDGAGFKMGSDATTTLYATWEERIYSITYDLDGGYNNASNPLAYSVTGGELNFATPTKAGYNFLGWYSDIGKTVAFNSIPQNSTGNKTVYAKWEAILYTLSFNKGDGSGDMDAVSVYAGQTITLPVCSFSKSLFKFAGWSNGYNGECAYIDNGTFTMGAGNHTLYALWTQKQFSLQYELNGGTNNALNPNGYDSDLGQTLYNPTKTGHTFGGWYTDSSFSTQIQSIPIGRTGNLKLYAKFTANKYKIIFDADGGNVSIGTIDVIYGEKIGTLPTVTKTGYTFTAWCENVYGSAYGNPYNESTVYLKTGNMTLHAWYTINYYNIFINTTNSTCSVTYSDGSGITDSKVPYGSTIKVNFSANNGYQNPSCTVNDIAIGNGGTYTVGDKNIVISVTSQAIPNSCLAGDSLIWMADGGTKRLDRVVLGDYIMTFDHLTGKILPSQVIYTYQHTECIDSLVLTFDKGKKLEILNSGHGLFDYTLQKYVFITPDNYEEFVGHIFIVAEGSEELSTAILQKGELSKKIATYYDIATANSYNHFANGFLCCSDILVDILNTFDFDASCGYDIPKMQADIENYGLFEYSEWEEYLTKEEFEAFRGEYYKITLGKGIMTLEQIFDAILVGLMQQ